MLKKILKRSNIFRVSGFFLLSTVLVSCSTAEQIISSDVVACPEIRIISDLTDKYVFEFGKARLEDHLIYHTSMRRVDSRCTKEDQGLDTYFNMYLLNHGTKKFDADLEPMVEYFVSLVDHQGKVVHKKNYVTDLKIDRDFKDYQIVPFDLELPDVPHDKVDEHILLFGFQLTESELSYNQKKLNK